MSTNVLEGIFLSLLVIVTLTIGGFAGLVVYRLFRSPR